MSQKSSTPKSTKKTRLSGSTSGGKNPQAPHLDYLRIMAAWRTDFWNTMDKLAPHVSANLDDDLWPVDGNAYLDLMQNRIATALEYIILDTEELKEFRGVVRSFEFGHELVADLVLKIILGEPDDEKLLEDFRGNLEDKLIQIHACTIALIARGQLRSACELARMAEVLLWIHLNLDSMGMLKPPYDKKFGPEKNRLKLLHYLASCIQRSVFPTLKTLRIEVFGDDMDNGNFSRLLNGMLIRDFIPGETTARKENSALTFHPIRPLLEGWSVTDEYIRLIASRYPDRKPYGNLADAEPDIAPFCSIRPSGNSEMAQSEIRKIRESLGAAYWQFLIQFGMGELETPEDLQVFVERLASIGLELK
jgi:hypothetical protein